jgi:hypothetical protein
MMGEIKILDFHPVHHVKHIYDWFKLRSMDLRLIDELPAIGTIALYKELGVAAAFLRCVEPNYGILDGLITNPEALPQLRNEAIDLCVEDIIKKSKKSKMKNLMATTIDEGVLKRSEKHGFLKLPHVSIILGLEGL